MDRQEPARDAFVAARDAGDERAMLAALERWIAPEPLNDEALLELLVLFEAPAFAERKLRAKLEVLLARAAWRAAVQVERVSRELLLMVLDVWQAGGEYGPQAACDIAGRLLLHEPADEYAFDLYVQASVADAYAHRGTSLEDVAEHTGDPRVRGRLLLAHAFVDHVVFRQRERAAAGVRRAFAADPSLAYEDVRARVLRCMGLAGTESAQCDEVLPPRDAW